METRTRRLLQGALGAFALGTAGCSVGAFTAWSAWFSPRKVQPAPFQCADDAPELPRGKRLRVLVWNIQYAGSRNHRFFYDGGTDVSASLDEVNATLDGIARVVARVDPDLILWQEVDVNSRRTQHVDELEQLLARVPYPCTASAPYHKAPYVPFPPSEHLGKVDMRLAVWSKYKIDKATRFDLPRLNESVLRQQFNLKRALLAVEFPVAGGGRFVAFDTHLSAFSNGDGTVSRQLAAIAEQLDAADAAGNTWILGADLNSLPPGDDPSRLGEHASLYEAASPLTDWFDRYTPAVALDEHHIDPQPWRTYLPWGSNTADRAIDYVFHAPGVQMHRYSVLQDVAELSDHHPLLFDFAL